MKIFVLFIIVVVVVACSGKLSYTVTGRIGGLSGMMRMVGNGKVIDTVEVNNGIFVMKGEVEEPTLVTLYSSSRAVATLILEEGEIRLDGELTDEDGNPSFPSGLGTIKPCKSFIYIVFLFIHPKFVPKLFPLIPSLHP